MTDTVTDQQYLTKWVEQNLEVHRWSGDEARVRCPFPGHKDTNPSMYVNVSKGVYHCHGCGAEGIVKGLADEIGLEPIECSRDGEYHPSVTREFHYTDTKGELAYTISRMINEKTFWVTPKGVKRRYLYKTKDVYQAIEDQRLIWWVEGEKDVESLNHYDITATTTAFGSNALKKSHTAINELPSGGKFLLVGDFDRAGRTYIQSVGKRLLSSGHSVQYLSHEDLGLPSDDEGGFDITDWILRENTSPISLVSHAKDFSELLEKAEEQLAEMIPLDDRGMAQRLVANHLDQIYWVENDRAFYIFDGSRWCRDETRQVYHMANKTIDDLHQEAVNADQSGQKVAIEKAIGRYRSNNSIENFVKSLKNVEGVAVGLEIFDLDLELINLQNGTYDLATHAFNGADPTDRITKIAGVRYDPEANAPRFRDFIQQIFEDNDEVIGFVQRLFGLCLSGSTPEHLLPVLYGTGRNGKSVLMNIMQRVLGDYASPADRRVVSAKTGNAGTASPELMQLKGVRFAVVGETNDGNRLNEAQVKYITGGDTITARPLYGQQVTFSPQFKIMLVTNYMPRITGSDNGIWRRVVLIPFTYTVPDEEVDPNLEHTLWSEASGILNWLLDGYRTYQTDGRLRIPKVIKLATETYRNEEDLVIEFLDTKCEIGEDFRSTTAELYASYAEYCKSLKEWPVSKRTFSERLSDKFTRSRTSKDRGFEGVRLIEDRSQQRFGYGYHDQKRGEFPMRQK